MRLRITISKEDGTVLDVVSVEQDEALTAVQMAACIIGDLEEYYEICDLPLEGYER